MCFSSTLKHILHTCSRLVDIRFASANGDASIPIQIACTRVDSNHVSLTSTRWAHLQLRNRVAKCARRCFIRLASHSCRNTTFLGGIAGRYVSLFASRGDDQHRGQVRLDSRGRDGHEVARVGAGDTTGYGFHADFIMGWKDPEALQQSFANCFDNDDCPWRSFGSPDGDDGHPSTLAPQVRAPRENVGLKRPIAKLPGNNPVYKPLASKGHAV